MTFYAYDYYQRTTHIAAGSAKGAYMTALSNSPLKGVRIVDMTRHMSGPYATVFLGDFGADVMKVESLPDGDASRSTGVKVDGKVSATFLMWNRSKRSIALDTRDPKAVDALCRLVETADVFMENYRPGVIDKIGLSYEKLARINPRLIYVSLSAFGEGPLAPFPGTDPVVQAMSGVMSVTGEPDGPPLLVGVPMADFTAAMITVQGVLLALLARRETGRGQKVDISMLHALMTSLTTRLSQFWALGKDPVRNGGAHSVVMPYQVWKTADGYAVAGVWNGGNVMWPKFCEALGVPDLGKVPAYETNELRLKNKPELEKIIQAEFTKRTTAEWEKSFQALGVLFSPVNTFSQILSHPHVQQSGIVGSLEHPVLGPLPQLTPPIQLHDTPGGFSRPAPMLGEHTVDILAEAGLSREEIDALLSNGAAKAYAA